MYAPYSILRQLLSPDKHQLHFHDEETSYYYLLDLVEYMNIFDSKNLHTPIHPANKQEVGRRLALWALAKDYGKQVAFSGPLYASMETKGNIVVISFNYAENGLKSAEGGLQNFQVAGEDRKFVQAKAIIEGNRVIVQSPLVIKPVSVRYLWDNASEASLFNMEGLPASSFRTDNW